MKDDLIRRGKFGNDIALYMAENAYLNDTALDVLKMIAKWVNEQPAVDAVEVVRCKDCKWRNTDGCPYMNFDAADREDSDFCSDGERRKDDA